MVANELWRELSTSAGIPLNRNKMAIFINYFRFFRDKENKNEFNQNDKICFLISCRLVFIFYCV